MLLRQEGEAGLKKDTQICPVFPVTARWENPVCRQRGELMGARDPFKKFFRRGTSAWESLPLYFFTKRHALERS